MAHTYIDQHQPDQGHIRFEFSVLDRDGWCVAGGDAPTHAQALREAEHYLAQYQQDGPHTLELRRVELLPPPPLSPRPPLWQEMQEAAIAAPLAAGSPAGAHYRSTITGQIRAVRDYIRAHVPGYGWHPWQIQQIVDLLNAEVERVELGSP
jgi:hypothetical protein